MLLDRKSTRLNSSHLKISYAVFCLKKKITSLRVYSQRLVAHFGLAFATARLRLTSPLRITSRLIMQKARGQAFRTCVRHSPPTACRYTVSGTISLPSQGFFSPFPHGTGSLSVTREYLALRDGPRSFSRDFTCPAILRVPIGASRLSSTGLSPSLAGRSRPFD